MTDRRFPRPLQWSGRAWLTLLFSVPVAVLTAPLERLSLVGLENLLAQANRLRRDFDIFIVADEFNRLLKVQDARRHQSDGFIGGRSAHVRELLFLDDVHVEVFFARVLADNHSFVDFGAGGHEYFPALLQVEYGVSGHLAGPIGHQRTGGASRDIALPVDVAVEQGIHDGGAARIGEDFAAQPDQAARRDVELQPYAPRAMIDHFDHL